MKIAVLKYSSDNIGDDIQALAMERLLPRIDLRIDRDDLGAARGWGPEVRFILQGWLGATMRIWPPVTGARLLWISVHCPEIDYVPPVGPVGVRDPWSLSLCESRGVEAWLSWCVSLTLTRPGVPRDGSVLLVDVPEEIRRRLPERIADGARLSHRVDPEVDRRAGAEDRLDRYARAAWVVTTRIHALLPCAALGTPVVFLPTPATRRRLAGYRHLAWAEMDAPWEQPRPRVEPSVVAAMMVPLRDTIRRFVET